MLVEFRVENFRCFRDEQVLSLVASNDADLPDNLASAGALRILRTAGVYGPNASGKSTLINAIEWMQGVIVGSSDVEAARTLAATQFLLDADSSSKPTTFEATLLLKGTRYQYGFALTSKRVEKEWLYVAPGSRPRRWFQRETNRKTGKSTWDWGSYFRGDKLRLARHTRPNALFLSVAAQFNHEQLTPLYEWFAKQVRTVGTRTELRAVTAMLLTSSVFERGFRDYLTNSVVRLLRDADLGIQDLRVKELELPTPTAILDGIPETQRPVILERLKDEFGFEVKMLHRNVGTGQNVPFDIDAESGGTQRLFQLAGPWIEALSLGYLVCLDEIDASLHPLLSRELVRLFQDPKQNQNGAQLIFTTHDTTLLDPELFRRDQIWFTEKDNDGVSKLYSLYDYKEHRARKGEAMQKRYLSGRYGALPVLRGFGLK